MDKGSRAKQFLPFDALKGYYKLVNKSNIVKEERRYLEDDGLKELLDNLNSLKRGDMVKITYYDNNQYIDIIGLVSLLDFHNQRIRVVKTYISIYDILSVYKYDDI